MTAIDPRPPHRNLMIGVWIALLVAVGAAGYLLRSFMLKTYGVDAFDSACNINETFNCDKINTSVWGKLFGLPVTAFALPTYAAWAALAWLGSSADDRARISLRLLQVSAGLALAYGAFLLFIMVSVEQTFCLFCLTMDAAAATVMVLATLSLRALGPAAGHLSWPGPLATAVVVGLASFGMTYTWHNDSKAQLMAQQMARAEKQAEQAKFDRAKLAAEQAKAAQATAGSASAGAAGTPGAAAAASGPQVAKKISNALYVVPVHPDDAVLGPADAKVTVVEYADFQCGYCKKLFYALQTVKARYKDRVRFVFKHFPMSTLCNPHLKNNKHRYACNAALAAECARRQGKFWPMHDLLFKNQHKLKGPDLRWYATQVGLDMDKYTTCMSAPEPRQNLKRSIDEGGLALELRATPRTFINGLLLSGSLPPEVLSRFIDDAFKAAGSAPVPAPTQPVVDKGLPTAAVAAAKPAGMVEIKSAKGAFWIDAYEASVDKSGRALSLAGAAPANASWYDAKAACEKAGKRLCTSFEWVTACQGKDAVDDDNNGNFADDYIEGNQFPYADYFEPARCHVNGDRRSGTPVKTGENASCRTPAGVFDLAGNVEEWIEQTEDRAQLAGGDFRVKEKGSCLRAHRSFGPGHRSRGIGFRCCADKRVANASDAAVERTAPTNLVGQKVGSFTAQRAVAGNGATGGAAAGAGFSEKDLLGKVTFVTFFASWCSPCRRELPELSTLVERFGKRGFQVLAVGVDTDAAETENFIRGHGRPTPGLVFAVDPNAKVLGRFDVTNMPTGYLVDRKGVIAHKQIGFGTKTTEELTPLIEKALGK